jgi:hypothetical protein
MAATVATYSGRSVLWNRVKGNGTEPKNVGWGTGAPAGDAAIGDVNLFAPASETRVAGTSTLLTTTQLADTYQVVGTLTAAGSRAITEAGLFDTNTANSATTTITNNPLTSGGTSITVTSATGFPGSGNYYCQIENEVVLITAGQGTTTWTATRGALGTTAAAHNLSTPITLGGDGGAGTGGATSGQTATVGASQGGNAFIHANFAVINLALNDSIQFTFKDQLT